MKMVGERSVLGRAKEVDLRRLAKWLNVDRWNTLGLVQLIETLERVCQ